MLVDAIILGTIATLIMDLFATLLRRAFGVGSLDYALVGRWIGHIPKGRVIHRPIMLSTPILAEAAIGWAAHYLIGMAFAAAYLALSRHVDTAGSGPLGPILFGAASVVAPLVSLQPALGAGLAARRMPDPWTSRMRSLCAHLAFGVGLWIGTLVLAQIDRI